MPYYLFQIRSADELNLVKNLDLLEVYDKFRDAKNEAKRLRSQASDDGLVFKVMFADNQLSAEEQLLEKRDKPVLMEHER